MWLSCSGSRGSLQIKIMGWVSEMFKSCESNHANPKESTALHRSSGADVG